LTFKMDRIIDSSAYSAARENLLTTDSLTVDHMCEVATIPAPFGAERTRAEWFATRLRELELDPVFDDAGNVFARSPARAAHAPGIVIAAHLDTVFPIDTEITLRRDGNRIHAPGISDNARGLAGAVALARALRAAAWPLRTPITFLATTGEEGAGDLRGAKHFVAANAATIAAFIALDGAGAARIITAGVGSRRLRARFHGPGGHSWSDFGTPNAIVAAGRAVHALAALPLATHPRTTLSVGRIGGGSSINAIPAEAWLEVDLRSEARDSILELESRVRTALVAAAAATRNGQRAVSCDIELFGDRPAGRTSHDHVLVQAAIAATQAMGATPDLTSSSTDANVAMAAGIPSIAIGAGGDAGGAHTVHEWYDNEAGVAGLERALMIVLTLAAD
jgi:acetylornithine deacetylase/succinyl-diaminopimelate desuccinylase-like protein